MRGGGLIRVSPKPALAVAQAGVRGKDLIPRRPQGRRTSGRAGEREAAPGQVGPGSRLRGPRQQGALAEAIWPGWSPTRGGGRISQQNPGREGGRGENSRDLRTLHLLMLGHQRPRWAPTTPWSLILPVLQLGKQVPRTHRLRPSSRAGAGGPSFTGEGGGWAPWLPGPPAADALSMPSSGTFGQRHCRFLETPPRHTPPCRTAHPRACRICRGGSEGTCHPWGP